MATNTSQQGAAVATPNNTAKENGLTVYQVNGMEVKLSFDIVRNYLVKGNAAVSQQEVVNFISVCKFNRLNPFLNEAYLVKFQGSPAQMIVSKEAMFKRAEECPEYEGIEAGIIVDRSGEILELEGCFKLANDVLLGGWAKVYRKDRRFPFVAKVNLSEYDKGQSIWKDKKNTMICKVAKVAALREAFPQKLGCMYASEELQAAACAAKDTAAAGSNTAKVTAEYAARATAKMRTQPAPAPIVEEAEILEVDETTGEINQTEPVAEPTPAAEPAAEPAAPKPYQESARSRAAHKQAAESAERLANTLFNI